MKQERKIVHVDDDPSLLRLIRKELTGRGYEVFSISDSNQLEETIVKTGARVVLLDIDMPNRDGLSLLKEIKNNDGGIQVIMLTGMVSMSTVLRSLRWGAEACVFKPMTESRTLIEALEAAFEKIDRWWMALEDLNQRKREQEQELDLTASAAN